jgi:hypothetical protein
MATDAEREHEDDRRRGERLADEVSERESNVGAGGLEPPRSARVAAGVLVHGGVSELAPSREASLVAAHAAGDERFDSAIEMELHLFRHLALESRVAEDGADPVPDAMHHGDGRWAMGDERRTAAMVNLWALH